MGLIGVPEVQRDIDDPAARVIEEPLPNIEPRPRDEAPEGQAVVG
jgi:hypothetical protein